MSFFIYSKLTKGEKPFLLKGKIRNAVPNARSGNQKQDSIRTAERKMDYRTAVENAVQDITKGTTKRMVKKCAGSPTVPIKKELGVSKSGCAHIWTNVPAWIAARQMFAYLSLIMFAGLRKLIYPDL